MLFVEGRGNPYDVSDRAEAVRQEMANRATVAEFLKGHPNATKEDILLHVALCMIKAYIHPDFFTPILSTLGNLLVKQDNPLPAEPGIGTVERSGDG